MGAKRKRRRSSKDDESVSSKKLRPVETTGTAINHPTLRLYYRHILSLREFLLSQLPKTSKKRRRSIASLGKSAQTNSTGSLTEQFGDPNGKEVLARLLDQTLVCSIDEYSANEYGYDAKDVEAFSQKVSLTARSSYGGRVYTQSELVDVAIRLLFYRVYQHTHRPPHMLCHGYQRARGEQQQNRDMCAVAGIIGITSHYPNNNVTTLKSALWDDVLELLGREGAQVMLKMIVHCGIYTRISNGRGNFYQLCGKPLPDLTVIVPTERPTKIEQPLSKDEGRGSEAAIHPTEGPRSPASICFVRSRMYYARAALNIKGEVIFGLRHIHALNRFPNFRNKNHTLQLLRYIFPREFGLHNGFTCNGDPKDTAQPYKDYTMRDAESAGKILTTERRSGTNVAGPRIPKRLLHGALKLVQKLQISHSKCSYSELLKHYCPSAHSQASRFGLNHETSLHDNVQGSALPGSISLRATDDIAAPEITADAKQSITDLATPQACVSAFCRAVICKAVPDDFWGEAENGKDNKELILHKVDRFIKLRKYDPMSLHEVSQGIKASVSIGILRRLED